MKDPYFYLIFEEDVPVLTNAFRSIPHGDVFLDAIRFRATYDADIGQLETLERRGHIRRENDSYYLWPTALAKISPDIPEAAAILTSCGEALNALRTHYKREPRQSITLDDLSILSGIKGEQLRVALWYIAKSGLLAGYTTDLLHAVMPTVLPGEQVLSVNSTKALMERLHRWLPTDAHWRSSNLADTKPQRKKRAGKASSRVDFGNIHFPEPLRQLFSEVDDAVERELCALASMGIRCVVDMICNDTVGDCGGFEKKLSVLQENGHITEPNRRAILSVVEAGNASAHRGFTPSQEQVDIAYRIAKHLAETTYLMPRATESFKDVPKRRS